SASLGTSSAVSAFPRLPVANLWSAGITSSIKPAITYDARDNQLFPRSGVFLQASAEVAPALLGSDNQFLRLRGTARFYHPLTSDGSVVFRWNSEAGFIASLGGGGVPLYSRFF